MKICGFILVFVALHNFDLVEHLWEMQQNLNANDNHDIAHCVDNFDDVSHVMQHHLLAV